MASGGWRAALLPEVYSALSLLEWRWPLRKRVDKRRPRLLRNAALAAVTAVVVRLLERPLVSPLAHWVDRNGFGLVPWLRLSPRLERGVTLLLLDYSLYVWHVMLHRLPWLWRVHVVHHSDLDLDVSTALRFHFGEFVASTPYRAAQVLVFGVRPATLTLWQRLTFAEVMFHHANLRLPLKLERLLIPVLVTPRLHGIHHSTVPEETGSNFSSGLTIWDYLHGTLRRNVPQVAITIGVPAYRDSSRLGVGELLMLPFGSQRPSWRSPGNRVPRRLPGEFDGGASFGRLAP